jgi:Flp pilus assembly protein TadD
MSSYKGSSESVVRASRRAFERAVARMRADDPQGAERICRKALARHPGDVNLHSMLGAALLRQGRAAAAEATLTRAIELAPHFAGAYEGRAEARIAQNRLADSVTDLQRARALAPRQISVLLKLGRVWLALGRDAEAAEVLLVLLSLHPAEPDVFHLLGGALCRLRRWAEAEAVLKRAVAQTPNSLRCWMDLGAVQQDRDRLAQAEHSFSRAAALAPANAAPQVALGVTAVLAGQHQAALAAFRRALEIDPTNAEALAGMGHVLKTLGDQEGAIHAYRACISAHPDDGEAYWALADFKTFQFDERDVEAMRTQLDSPSLAPARRIGLLFALGTALDRRGEFAAAFECFQQGNRLRRQQEKYDPAAVSRLHGELREIFSAEFLAARAESGNPDAAPIFIVGMPRSGSTLVEQILSSHSAVDGTYELPELSQVAQSTARGRTDSLAYPATIRELSDTDLKALGTRYLELTRAHRGNRARFTDKMPNNFVHVGLLSLILPNARIVNVRRNPLDTCLSCYMQLFSHGQSFSYDLSELGGHYLEYHRLMDYWHEVLPGRVMDLQYEDLVADLEEQVRRLLDYCNLPWEDACLKYHESRRVIRSASSEQVRQPLYRDALNRWRNYERYLQPLLKALGPLQFGRNGQ